jgi:hypothetical protein
MDLGDFTPDETLDPEAEVDTFQFCGQTFEIPPTRGAGSSLEFTWLIKQADGQAKRGRAHRQRALTDEGRAKANAEIIEADVSATAAIYKLLSALLGEGQMDRFLRAVDANNVQPLALMEVCDRLQEAIAERPTRRSADSSAGPSTTGLTSTAGGSGHTETLPPMSALDMQMASIHAASTSPVGSPA